MNLVSISCGLAWQMLGDQRGEIRVETDDVVIAVIGLKRRVGDLHPHLKDALGQQFRRLGDREKQALTARVSATRREIFSGC